MSLLFFDGFESYGTTGTLTGLDRRYTGVPGTITGIAGRFSGRAIRCSSVSTAFFDYVIGSTHTDVVLGFAVRNISNTQSFIALLNGSNSLSASLRRTSGGKLAINLPSGSEHEVSSLDFDTSDWVYVEIKLHTNATTGSYEVRVNGVLWLSDSGVNTNNNVAVIRIGSANITVEFDDLYLLNDSGATNNDFLGPQRIEAITVTSAGDVTEWTPSEASDNYTLVDENPTDDDTTYVEESTSTDQDLYNYSSLAALTSVNGVAVITTFKRPSGSETLQISCKSGTSEDNVNANATHSTSYTTDTTLFEQDPDTTSPWTVSGVNAAQFGVKVG